MELAAFGVGVGAVLIEVPRSGAAGAYCVPDNKFLESSLRFEGLFRVDGD